MDFLDFFGMKPPPVQQQQVGGVDANSINRLFDMNVTQNDVNAAAKRAVEYVQRTFTTKPESAIKNLSPSHFTDIVFGPRRSDTLNTEFKHLAAKVQDHKSIQGKLNAIFQDDAVIRQALTNANNGNLTIITSSKEQQQQQQQRSVNEDDDDDDDDDDDYDDNNENNNKNNNMNNNNNHNKNNNNNSNNNNNNGLKHMISVLSASITYVHGQSFLVYLCLCDH